MRILSSLLQMPPEDMGLADYVDQYLLSCKLLSRSFAIGKHSSQLVPLNIGKPKFMIHNDITLTFKNWKHIILS